MSAVRLWPVLLAGALAASACTGSRQAPDTEAGTGAEADAASATAADPSGGEPRRLYEALQAHCGQAYAGVVDPDLPPGADPAWTAAAPILHVRACEPTLKALSVVRGDDRALVWLLSVRDGSLRLQHLNYNDDASARPGSGLFSVARADSAAGRVQFEPEFENSANPGPRVSIALDAGTLVYESVSGQGRLRVRFDLATPVPAPPLPWMEAPVR